MKTNKYILALGFISPLTVMANPIVTASEIPPSLFFEQPIIPLLIESLIVALAGRAKGTKFLSTLAFWFLITNLTFLPLQWLFEKTPDSQVAYDLLLIETAIVLIETLALRYWIKKQVGRILFFYPLLIAFFVNLVSFALGFMLAIS